MSEPWGGWLDQLLGSAPESLGQQVWKGPEVLDFQKVVALPMPDLGPHFEKNWHRLCPLLTKQNHLRQDPPEKLLFIVSLHTGRLREALNLSSIALCANNTCLHACAGEAIVPPPLWPSAAPSFLPRAFTPPQCAWGHPQLASSWAGLTGSTLSEAGR